MSAASVPVLLYHSVATKGAPAYRPWMVSPERFSRQMAFLARNGYEGITASALAAYRTAGTQLPAKPILITFDDGLGDFASGALPVLRQFGFPATLFVVTDHVGGTSRWLARLGEGNRPMLSWSELRDLENQGVECGAHTCTHPQLDIIPHAAARDEIVNSKAALEKALGRSVRAFAYPHGYASGAIRRLVREAGFSVAFGVRNRSSSTSQDNFALSRITITEDVDDRRMHQVLAQPSSSLNLAFDRLLVAGWRFARRLEHSIRKTA